MDSCCCAPGSKFFERVRLHADDVRERERLNPVNWEARRSVWLSQLQRMFGMIESWTEPLVHAGLVVVERHPMTLYEDRLGHYDTETLTVRIEDERLNFVPVCALVFGAFGRVDVRGPFGRVLLFLADDSPDPALERADWGLCYLRSGHNLAPFDQQGFQQMFVEMMGMEV